VSDFRLGPAFFVAQQHNKNPPARHRGILFCESAKDSLTILWALLTALLPTLLAATALLAAFSRCLSLLTWFLLTTLLTALLAALLLPTHFFVSHEAILLRGRISAGGQSPRDTVGSPIGQMHG
jgi:hypothetical protein